MTDRESRRRFVAAASLALFGTNVTGAWAADGDPRPPRYVLLKLDDVLAAKDGRLSARWERAIAQLDQWRVASSLGIVGDSLVAPGDDYLARLRTIAASPLIEIWNHGFLNKFVPDPGTAEKTAYVGTSADRQQGFIQKTQDLVRKHLHLVPVVFGPHDSGTDENTYIALKRIPEIRAIWTYAPRNPAWTNLFVFRRDANMEHPIFRPNLDGLKTDLATNKIPADYIALQGHPDQWDDARYAGFVEIVTWLREQGCQFLRASDYLQQQHK